MHEFSIELDLRPPLDSSDESWYNYRMATDIVPGTFLVEDSTCPTLVLPICAWSLNDALLIGAGVVGSLGLEIVKGAGYLISFNSDDMENVSDFLPSWFDSNPTGVVQRKADFECWSGPVALPTCDEPRLAFDGAAGEVCGNCGREWDCCPGRVD